MARRRDLLEEGEAFFIDEDQAIEVFVAFAMSGEFRFTNATEYLRKRLSELPAYVMPKLEKR